MCFYRIQRLSSIFYFAWSHYEWWYTIIFKHTNRVSMKPKVVALYGPSKKEGTCYFTLYSLMPQNETCKSNNENENQFHFNTQHMIINWSGTICNFWQREVKSKFIFMEKYVTAIYTKAILHCWKFSPMLSNGSMFSK